MTQPKSDPLTSADEAPQANDPRVNARIQQLRQLIARGFDVEAFMASEPGRYIQQRASEELQQAQDALVGVNPTDAAAVAALQLDARVAQRVLTYFGDMVDEALAAEAAHRAEFESDGE